MTARRFHLVRDTDLSGVSGTGVVVDGVQFPDGTCAYKWRGPLSTVTVAESIAVVEAVHGHGGATRIEWVDQ